MGNGFKTWMSQAEIGMIESYLKPDFSMLEWGCGGSTLHFSRFVKKYYSIEHNETWFEKIKPETNNKNISLHFAPEKNNYKEYVYHPLNFDLKFDAILVDGRQRSRCLELAANRLTHKDSVVFIHDFWERFKYHEAVRAYYNIIDFISEGQSLAVLRRK